jgi:hypothetical protein
VLGNQAAFGGLDRSVAIFFDELRKQAAAAGLALEGREVRLQASGLT